MPSKKRYYMPIKMRLWSQLAVLGMPLDVVATPSLGVGFVPLFPSLEALREHYPDAEFAAVETTTKGETNAE